MKRCLTIILLSISVLQIAAQNDDLLPDSILSVADSIAELRESAASNTLCATRFPAKKFTAKGWNNPQGEEVVPYRFRANQLITPAALIVAGSIGVNAFRNFKYTEREWFKDLRRDRYLHFDDWIQYAPAVGYLGLGLCGVPSRHDMIDRICAGVTAYAIMAVLTNSIKYTVGEMRPNMAARNSFPSGHSGTVFCGAELMRLEYGNYIGIAGYAVAVTTGFMRMYNEKHWYNDILAGAGIGILSARIAYWLMPWERKLFKRIRPDGVAGMAVAALPYYDADSRGAGLAFTATF